MQRPLDPDELAAYERELSAMHTSLAQKVEALERAAVVAEGAQAQADSGADDYNREVDFDLVEAGDELLREVVEALRRMRGGSFGHCEACGGPIARRRLAQVPYARACGACSRAGST